MALAYSKDLRVRALDLIMSGSSLSQVSRILKISRPTLYRWLKQLETTGSTMRKELPKYDFDIHQAADAAFQYL